MYKQMDIFDFIERPIVPSPPKPLFEQLFLKINDPVIVCVNCLCQYCTRNAEELYNTVKLDEAAEEPCLNCDKCRTFTGEQVHREQARKDCENFIMSEHGANRKRKEIRAI